MVRHTHNTTHTRSNGPGRQAWGHARGWWGRVEQAHRRVKDTRPQPTGGWGRGKGEGCMCAGHVHAGGEWGRGKVGGGKLGRHKICQNRHCGGRRFHEVVGRW